MRGVVLAAVFGFVARARARRRGAAPARRGARRCSSAPAGPRRSGTRGRARRRRRDPARRARRARRADDAPRAARRAAGRGRRSCSPRVAASTSSAVAKGGLVVVAALGLLHRAAAAGERRVRLGRAVQRHPLPDASGRPCSRSRRRARSLYWRAAVLDSFDARPLGRGAAAAAATRSSRRATSTPLLRQDVHVLALAGHAARRCERAAFASTPATRRSCRTSPGHRVAAVRPDARASATRRGATRRGRRRRSSRASRPVYPVELVERGTFLDVWPGVTMPPFGAPARQRSRADRRPPGARALRAALRAALAVAGARATRRTRPRPRSSRGSASTAASRYTNHPAVDVGRRRSSASSRRRARATASTSPARWR